MPISYRGRTYQEGKKIGWRDGVKALYTIVKYWLIDAIYRDDAHGGQTLHNLYRARRFNGWMADSIRPFVGARVLEIGAGIGNITNCMLPRECHVASDINAHYLHYLQNYAAGKPHLRIEHVDIGDAATFSGLETGFDTVICLNVLEHFEEPVPALANLYRALETGGRLLLYVPAGPKRHSSLDEALGHRCRYDQETLGDEILAAGFEVENLRDFKQLSVAGWWWNGRIMKKKAFSRVQPKMLDLAVPLLRRLDRFAPWNGSELIAIARRPGPEALPVEKRVTETG